MLRGGNHQCTDMRGLIGGSSAMALIRGFLLLATLGMVSTTTASDISIPMSIPKIETGKNDTASSNDSSLNHGHCPDTSWFWKGKCYSLVRDADFISGADRSCASSNGYLVSIETEEESDFLFEKICDSGGLELVTHIGLHRTNEYPTWMWATGLPLQDGGFQNFKLPTTDTSKNCVVYLCEHDFWDVRTCDKEKFPYICETDAEKPTDAGKQEPERDSSEEGGDPQQQQERQQQGQQVRLQNQQRRQQQQRQGQSMRQQRQQNHQRQQQQQQNRHQQQQRQNRHQRQQQQHSHQQHQQQRQGERQPDLKQQERQPPLELMQFGRPQEVIEQVMDDDESDDVEALLLKELGTQPILGPVEPETTLKQTSHERGCEGVGIVNVKRRLTFQQCAEVCHTHGGRFFAPTSFQAGACLDNVHGAHEPFWINTVQVLPRWGQTTGGQLLNLMTNHYVPNYSPIVDRNRPNGVPLYDGVSHGRGVNCLYVLKGQAFGTKCQNGAEPTQCACQGSVEHQHHSCDRVMVVDTEPNLPGVRASECEFVCGLNSMDFFGPTSNHDLACLKNSHTPAWINLVQVFPVPHSKAFSMLYNTMTKRIQSSFSTRIHGGTPFDVEPIPHSGQSRGVSQNCIIHANLQNPQAKLLHGTNCDTGQQVRACACIRPFKGFSPFGPGGPPGPGESPDE